MHRFSWWDKNKKATVNPINKNDNKCFGHTVTFVLNYEKIKKFPQRITTIKPFINKYNWKWIKFPSEKIYCKKLGKNNVINAPNVLHAGKEKIYSPYVSKHNLNHWKQVIFLTTPNREKLWHYLVVKRHSALLWGMTSNHYPDFYCLCCLHLFRTKN